MKKSSGKKVFGSANYLAPEILDSEGTHGKEVDFWALGVILFQLLVGRLPFIDTDLEKIFYNIENIRIDWPRIVKRLELSGNIDAISEEAYILINGLLQKDPKKRLGNKGIDEIKKIDFFKGIQNI